MPKRQTNLQLPQNTMDVLEAEVYVREHRSLQELLRPAIERLARELEKDPDVAQVVKMRRKQRNRGTSNVTPLGRKKKT